MDEVSYRAIKWWGRGEGRTERVEGGGERADIAPSSQPATQQQTNKVKIL